MEEIVVIHMELLEVSYLKSGKREMSSTFDKSTLTENWRLRGSLGSGIGRTLFMHHTPMKTARFPRILFQRLRKNDRHGRMGVGITREGS
jgi:hypothetical protein